MLKETQKAVEQISALIVEEAKNNLTKSKKIASGNLYNNIKPKALKVTNKSIESIITMPYYGAFVDKGVSGTETKYNTPYSYKDKKPPTSAFDKWSVVRGLAPRDAKGRFISRDSLKFALSNHIYKNGIKPTLFLTNAFRKYSNELLKNIEGAFFKDIEDAIEFNIKANLKDK